MLLIKWKSTLGAEFSFGSTPLLLRYIFSGIYCLLATSLMLDILTPELVKGTATFVASCQTYEGGFASSSQPYFTLGTPTPLAHPRPALGEAHGGYTFCYIASWLILHPFIAELPEESRPTINTKLLLRWLVQMQGIESELGGFKGRTNKLVDGCYSWWVGGAFALIDALGVSEHPPVIDSPETDAWDDADGQYLQLIFRLASYLLYPRCIVRSKCPSRICSTRWPTSCGRPSRQATQVKSWLYVKLD